MKVSKKTPGKLISSQLLVLVLGISIISPVYAALGWSRGMEIDRIEVYEENKVKLYITDPTTGDGNDITCNPMYVLVGMNAQTADSVKSVLSLAMMAKTTERTVDVYHDTSSANYCSVRNFIVN